MLSWSLGNECKRCIIPIYTKLRSFLARSFPSGMENSICHQMKTFLRLLPVLKTVSSAIKSAFLHLTSENGQIPARLVPVTDILRSVEVGNLGYHHSHPFVAVNCSSLNSYANFMQICIFFNLPIAYFHGCKIRLILKTRRELKDAPSKQRNSSCNTKCKTRKSCS
jgi:hypothetical protein